MLVELWTNLLQGIPMKNDSLTSCKHPKQTLSSYSLLPLLENEEEKILCTNELGEKSCV
jgi:hypothetical protein